MCARVERKGQNTPERAELCHGAPKRMPTQNQATPRRLCKLIQLLDLDSTRPRQETPMGGWDGLCGGLGVLGG